MITYKTADGIRFHVFSVSNAGDYLKDGVIRENLHNTYDIIAESGDKITIYTLT